MLILFWFHSNTFRSLPFNVSRWIWFGSNQMMINNECIKPLTKMLFGFSVLIASNLFGWSTILIVVRFEFGKMSFYFHSFWQLSRPKRTNVQHKTIASNNSAFEFMHRTSSLLLSSEH